MQAGNGDIFDYVHYSRCVGSMGARKRSDWQEVELAEKAGKASVRKMRLR